MWDPIVSVPDHCLPFYFSKTIKSIFLALATLNFMSHAFSHIANLFKVKR